MVARSARAEWHGGLMDGKGSVHLGSGAFSGPYSFRTRMEHDQGTNPEELIGAAHAGCYAMQLSAMLGHAGSPAKSIMATAQVHLEKEGAGFAIPKIALTVQAEVPGMDEATFLKHANEAKVSCPVSKALAGPEITLEARLIGV